MKMLFLLAMTSLLHGCASAPLGRVTRYEYLGQQVICWEPSRKLNGLATFVANRLESTKPVAH